MLLIPPIFTTTRLRRDGGTPPHEHKEPGRAFPRRHITWAWGSPPW